MNKGRNNRQTAEQAVRSLGLRGATKGIVLVLAQALPIMAVVSLFPAIPKMMQQFGGIQNAAFLVPMIITVPSFCIALLSSPVGWLTDKVGRRPLFIGALALYAITGLAPLVLNGLVPIIASRALLGVAEAGIVTVGSTLIADYFGEDRYRWLALQSGLGSVFGTLLIALGGWLADASWRGPFSIYVAAIPLLIISILIIDEPRIQKRDVIEQIRAPFPWKIALLVGVVSLIASTLYYVEPTNIATLFQQRGVQSSSQIGLIQAATSLAYIVGAYVYKRVSHQQIGSQLAIAGSLIGIGMVGIGLSGSWQQAAGWALVQQLGGGMVIPALTGWAQGIMPLDQRGRAMGIWATFFFAGLFLCPTVVELMRTATGALSPTFLILGLIGCSFAAISGATARGFGRRISAP